MGVEGGGEIPPALANMLGKNQVVSESIVYFQLHSNLQVGFPYSLSKDGRKGSQMPESGLGGGSL